jgi:signal transduction histidine kinase
MRRLNESLERQARQIAQALHDEAGQFLTSAHIAWQRPVAICRRPRILDDLGLLPALHFLAEGVEKRHGISITIEATLQGRLPAAIETTVYRLAQEASLQVAGRRSP